MKLTRKLTALAMAVLLAFTLTACSPKAWAQDTVVKLVKAMGLVEESEDDDTDTTIKAAAGGSVEFPEGMDTSAARVVTYPQDLQRHCQPLHRVFCGGRRQHDGDRLRHDRGQQREIYVL